MSRIINFAVYSFPFAAAGGVSAISLYNIYRHTFNAENDSKNNSYYGDLKAPLDNHTQAAVDKVIDKLLVKFSAKQMAKTEFYWSSKPSIHVTGCTATRFGPFIGIPVHYRYKDVSEVDLTDTQTGENSSVEHTELLKKLKESLVLSEDAKKFSISAEFFSADSYHILMNFVAVGMLLGAFLTLQFGFHKPLLKASPAKVLFIFVEVACLWAVFYNVTSGLYYKQLRVFSDKKAAQLGDDFLEGGLEYLTKQADRNKVLRELYPETAGVFYKPNGDEKHSFFDIFAISTSERILWLQKLKKKQQEKDTSTEEKVDP